MLTRYTVLESFTLDGDLFLKDSTFLHDDEEIGELLRKAGLLSVKPTMFSITVEEDPYQSTTYLTQMNKQEMLLVAKNEDIFVDPKWTKRQVLAEIKKIRALRGEKKR
ncbi:MAG: hypothetical protein IIW48_07385 [Clostridia bacterium]|nr:hypothetical protein [Clostridia bacterium]